MTRTPKPVEGADADDAVVIPVDQFVTSASVAIAVSSLLVRKPDLRDAHLTQEQWQAALDADQATPTH